MEQQFSNRSAQQAQPQQHVYSAPPYTVYTGQPPYISANYQTAPQPQPISYQQTTNRYTATRQMTPNQNLSTQSFAAPSNTQLPQRRVGSGVGSTAGNAMLPISGAPSHQRFSSARDASHTISAASMHAFNSYTPHNRPPLTELPLRMVVDAKYVGAIIGQRGSCIREITKDSKARCVVDVQKAVRDPLGNAEKVISILGQPESCSRACMRILEVIRQEMEKDDSLKNNNEYELKLRAHNQLVGRLIGKGGSTIKKIMEETGAVVSVSNDPATPRDGGLTSSAYGATMYPPEMNLVTERTIIIKGPDMDTVFAAEQKISQKLRQSYEYDLNNRVYSYGQTPNALPLMNPLGCPDPSAFLNTTGSSTSAHINRLGATAPLGKLPAQNQPVYVIRMWVPNGIVGALIGPKGSNIRNIMQGTGAYVRIEGGPNKDKKNKADTNNATAAPETNEVNTENNNNRTETQQISNETTSSDKGSERKDNAEEGESAKATSGLKESSQEKDTNKDMHADERLVVITGSEPQQYKAQYCIHQRVAEQTNTYIDNLRLYTEVSVPSKIVGRIVGKGGQNVRELQRVTGAQVKIPEDSGEMDSRDTTTVRVYGNFRASQAVQVRLAQLTRDFAEKLTWFSNGQSASTTAGGGAKQGGQLKC
uniref:KH domain-containing protein n=1 Tax=Syphacia muris TaxID=451379 RepID=A0A0N5ANF7_9BILA